MIRARLLPFLALLAPGVAAYAALMAVPERVSLRKTHFERRFAHGHVHVNLKYPQVTGLRDTALQARINHTIRSAYPPAEGFEWWLTLGAQDLELEVEEPGVVEEVECDYEVGLNRSRTLSIHFWGCDDFQKDGHDLGAHPNCQDAAVTLDTRTGRPFKLRDLFAGRNWRDRLDHIIVRYTTAGKPEGGLKDQELLDMVRNHEYWYYLTPHTCAVYDITTSYAARALRASIPYSGLKPIMNPKGPLPALLGSRR